MCSGFRRAHNQLSVLYSLSADQAVLHVLGFSAKPTPDSFRDPDSMQRGNNHMMMLMLQIGKLLRQQPVWVEWCGRSLTSFSDAHGN